MTVTALFRKYGYTKPMRIGSKIIVFVLISGASVSAQAQSTVRITGFECSQLVRHVTSSDVDYRTGVDVNGNAMAPADLNAQPQIRVPDVVSIPITIDLATNLGIETPFVARPTLGDVEITRDGRVSFNGQPIGDAAQHELAQRCQQIGTAN